MFETLCDPDQGTSIPARDRGGLAHLSHGAGHQGHRVLRQPVRRQPRPSASGCTGLGLNADGTWKGSPPQPRRQREGEACESSGRFQLSSLHDACLDDTLWPEASARFDQAFGARGNCLVLASGTTDEADVLLARFCRGGYHMAESRDDYFNYYFEDDERGPRLAQQPDGLVTPIRDLYTAEEIKTSRTFNEHMLRGECQNGLNVRLDGPGDASTYWVVDDPVTRGGWGPRQLEMVDALLPHLRHFVRVRHALGGAESLSLRLGDLMNNSGLRRHLPERRRAHRRNERRGAPGAPGG